MSSSNPNFQANTSSDEIYFGQDATTCLTDVINGKASLSHTHSNYASSSHTHTASAIGAIPSGDIATVLEVQTYLNI